MATPSQQYQHMEQHARHNQALQLIIASEKKWGDDLIAFNKAAEKVRLSTRYPKGAEGLEIAKVLSEMKHAYATWMKSAKAKIRGLANDYKRDGSAEQVEQTIITMKSNIDEQLADIAARHGSAGEQALQAVQEQMQENSLGIVGRATNFVTKSFYDSDKGGMQWGGIIGALLGGGLALGLKHYGLGSILGNGIVGQVLTALAVPVFAVMGAKVVSGLAGHFFRSNDSLSNVSPPGLAMAPKHDHGQSTGMMTGVKPPVRTPVVVNKPPGAQPGLNV